MANPPQVVIPSPTNVDELRGSSQLLNDNLIHYQRACDNLRCPALVTSFLVITSLIVIAASCLCLGLPGVNVINDVVLPGILPGCTGLIFAIPFMIESVHYNKVKNNIYDNHLYPRVMSILDSTLIDEAPADRKVVFVETYIMRGSPEENRRLYQDFYRIVFSAAMKEYGERTKALEEPIKDRKEQLKAGAENAKAQPDADEAAIEAEYQRQLTQLEAPIKADRDCIEVRTKAISGALENLHQSSKKQRKT